MNRRRELLVPTIFAAVGLAILLSLGFWQLERREWKHAIIARAEQNSRAPAVDLPPESQWPAFAVAANEYRRVRATGRFVHDREALVHTVVSAGRHGYSLLTPLELASGAMLIVNRGYVPLDRGDPVTRRQGQVEGETTVTGLLRLPEPAHWFTPESDPAMRMFFVRDPAEIAAAYDLMRVAPFILDADATANPGGLPLGGQTRLVFTDNHLNYAITWFGLALALVGVYFALLWTRLTSR